MTEKISDIVDRLSMVFSDISSTANDLSNYSSDTAAQTFGMRVAGFATSITYDLYELSKRLQEIEDLANILKNPSDIVKNRIEKSSS